jgi:hypothetical protein
VICSGLGCCCVLTVCVCTGEERGYSVQGLAGWEITSVSSSVAGLLRPCALHLGTVLSLPWTLLACPCACSANALRGPLVVVAAGVCL